MSAPGATSAPQAGLTRSPATEGRAPGRSATGGGAPSGSATWLADPRVDAVLDATATLLGTEVVFVGMFAGEDYAFARLRGQWEGLTEGQRIPQEHALCTRMLAGAPNASADVAADPVYGSSPVVAELGIGSYIGVPVTTASGEVFGTLCGLDHASVPVSGATLALLRHLAAVLAAHLDGQAAQGTVVRRTPRGWQVGDDPEPAESLVNALTLADLLSEDAQVPGRPARPGQVEDELDRLRTAVTQLEHALTARVAVEQAIGVLSERFGLAPRPAFERLRSVARRHGRRVHDLARDVVRSVGDPTCPLPLELARPQRRPG